MLEELSASVEVAKRVGARQLHTFSDGIGPGGVILRPPPLPWEARYQACVEGLGEAAKLVEGTGITLAVEAINNVYVPGYFWDEVGITLALCRAVNHPRVRLAFDCFHQQLSGGRLTDHLREACHGWGGSTWPMCRDEDSPAPVRSTMSTCARSWKRGLRRLGFFRVGPGERRRDRACRQVFGF